MKLERGRAIYSMPPHSQIQFVNVTADGVTYRVTLLPIQHMNDKRNHPLHRDATGIPRYVAYDPGYEKLVFWPTPDAAYLCRVQYTPPVMEI